MTPESRPANDLAVEESPAQLLDNDELRRVVAELFATCEQRIHRYLIQLVRDRDLAADLLQDTFHDALSDRGRLLGARSREAWLFGIARHHALRALRKKRRFDTALRRLASRRPYVGETPEIVAVYDLLERTLSVEDRTLVLLRYLHDFETAEIAQIAGLSPDAVRQRLSRARSRLVAASNPNDRST